MLTFPRSSLRHLSAFALLPLLLASAAMVSAQTVITSVPHTITASGHYAINRNLNSNAANTPAITIAAPNVILELNGFYVAGPSNPGASLTPNNSTILVGDVPNVTIRDGLVAGDAYGIYFSATTATNSRNYVVESVTVTRCYYCGIYVRSAAPGSQINTCAFSFIGNSALASNPVAIWTHVGVRVERNNIGDVTGPGGAASVGISATHGDFIISNTISNCTYGSLSGKCSNNLTYNVGTPFFGIIDAGGNN